MPKTHRTIPPLTEQDTQRFWSKVDKSSGQGPNGDCWEWTRDKDKDGYGRFGLRVGLIMPPFVATRISYMLASGDDPVGFEVCHTCDNPPCCNPAHLFKGTTKDNAQDSMNKGRRASGERHGLRVHPERTARGLRHGAYTKPESRRRGETHGMAKISETTVREMRALYDTGRQTKFRTLGRLYGMSGTNAKRIVLRQSWQHIVS